LGLAPGQELPVAELAQQGYDVAPYGERWELHLTEEQSIDPVVDLARARGLSVRHLVEKRQSLEDLFVETLESDERDMAEKRERRPRR
jgi:ABC-2 type transport system ATP-binding protein